MVEAPDLQGMVAQWEQRLVDRRAKLSTLLAQSSEPSEEIAQVHGEIMRLVHLIDAWAPREDRR